MVTSTRAIVNTARSMVSTIMKFLDSGPGKATDGNLKARVMTSEPDNAEGLHNFAPLGYFDAVTSFRTQFLRYWNLKPFINSVICLSLHRHNHIQQPNSAASRGSPPSHTTPPPGPLSSLVIHLPARGGLVWSNHPPPSCCAVKGAPHPASPRLSSQWVAHSLIIKVIKK